MAFLGKEYKFVKDENFDEFLKASGVPDAELARITQGKPNIKLEKDGDSYVYTTITPEKTKVIKFKPGVEQDEELREGVVIKSTYNVEGNVVTQNIKTGDKITTFKREFDGNNLKLTITTNYWNGVAARYFAA